MSPDHSLETVFAAAMAPLLAGGAWPGAVAVSGGGDSVALMHLLRRWAAKARVTPPVVLTVDHGLRPESGREARAVARAARALGLSAAVLRWEPDAKAKGGLEAAARQARYGLMGAWLKRHRLTTLYVAHNLDDQAETFLLRLARGSGLDGLSAMRVLGDYPHPDFPGLAVARPLLGTGREALRAWLTRQGAAWTEDPMNQDPRFDRVRMRRLAPALAQAGLTPARIALAADHMANAREALEAATGAVLARACRPAPPGPDAGMGGGAGLLLDPAALAAAPRELGLRALAALLQRVSGAAYRPRFDSLERLFDRICQDSLGGGATLGGCRLGPAPVRERLFGPHTLKLTPETRSRVPAGGVAGGRQRS